MRKADKNNGIHKMMIGITVLDAVALLAFAVLYQSVQASIFLSLAITFGTICYHFAMRLVVGFAVNVILKRDLNYNGEWFRPKKFEDKLYQRLAVKKWKDKMPTYNPDDFSLKEHTLQEIVQTMCRSELGHEMMVVLSFVPLLFALPWGCFPVFLITSVAAGLVDTAFLILQRYNRPRLVRIIEKRKTL